jgi:DNA (cytosine-5)-methyltransferase 1
VPGWGGVVKLNVLSLFAGIGGLELGLERAGMTTVGQVELDPYCQRVLARHWPEVPRHDDVRTTPAWWLAEDRPSVHVVCGGFPCQPFSEAGSRLGVGDPRWGWPWFADVVRAVRPSYVVVENVAALLRHNAAFGTVLADLAALGFDAQWSVLSACALGAPHTRERVFLVAHPNDERPQALGNQRVRDDFAVAARGVRAEHLHAATEPDLSARRSDWSSEPDVGRLADGLSPALDRRRLFALGNAVVPAVAEHIGRLIVEDAEWRTEAAA